jgi:phosphoglycolate phosphatase-like HAD superfamily hydrolase
MAMATSQFAEVAHPISRSTEVLPPRRVERGVVVFDLDGTLLDDLALISTVAANVMAQTFGTSEEEARIHYLATTGMPFEAQLAQLYPDAPAPLRVTAARTFHQRKVREAYTRAHPFPEVPKLLNTLDRERWTLTIATGAETEMAELILEREGLRYWFDAVLGSGDGTKREHLAEYRRRYPEVPMFLVGDSRFDMEAALSVPGVIAIARASRLAGWSLSPSDFLKWGASWAGYTLSGLPRTLDSLARDRRRGPSRRPAQGRPRRS